MPAAPDPAVKPAQNTLRIDARRLGALLDDLDRRSGTSVKRAHVRWPFRHTDLKIRVMHTGGGNTSLTVACRNISASGISVLHSAYIHAGTRIDVMLPHVDGHIVEVEGTVARCNHVTGVVHEVGIRFKENVRAREFIKLDPFADGFSLENVNPESLTGNILMIEDSVLDQSLVRHFLRGTQVRLQNAETFEKGIEIANAGVDLILCDYNVAGANATEFMAKLRSLGISTPVVMITADTSQRTREAMIKAEADAFVAKPISQNLLMRAIAEFLMSGDALGLTTSSLAESHPNYGLLENYITQVRTLAANLEKGIRDQNFESCRDVCLQVAGTASLLGFEKLAKLAQSAEIALNASMSVEESLKPLRQVAMACKSVRKAA